MEDTDLHALMARLELLISRVEQLNRQNALLTAQEKTWREERAHLMTQLITLGRQADLIELKRRCHAIPQRAATSGQNSSAPPWAILLPSSTAQ